MWAATQWVAWKLGYQRQLAWTPLVRADLGSSGAICHLPSSGGGTPMTPMRLMSSTREPTSPPRAVSFRSRSPSVCRYGGHAKQRPLRPTAQPAGRLHQKFVRLVLLRQMASCSDGSSAITCVTMDQNMCCALRRHDPAKELGSWYRLC
jgi:hypothetical protein